ncbi:MAG: hypothetical protein M3Q11_04075 [Pseudomonadota bacterium]|nr:hypothetical protein [Pseudomonadota bacterium]
MNHPYKVGAPREDHGEFERCLEKLGHLSGAGWQISRPQCRGEPHAASVENSGELIAATVAGCFSMLLSGMLSREGHPPAQLETGGRVELCTSPKPMLSKLYLTCTASVPGMADAAFQAVAQRAKARVSESLNSVEIHLKAEKVA